MKIDVPLWQVMPSADRKSFVMARRLDDSHPAGRRIEQIDQSFSTEGAAKVVAAILNTEMVESYRRTIAQARRDIGETEIGL